MLGKGSFPKFFPKWMKQKVWGLESHILPELGGRAPLGAGRPPRSQERRVAAHPTSMAPFPLPRPGAGTSPRRGPAMGSSLPGITTQRTQHLRRDMSQCGFPHVGRGKSWTQHKTWTYGKGRPGWGGDRPGRARGWPPARSLQAAQRRVLKATLTRTGSPGRPPG